MEQLAAHIARTEPGLRRFTHPNLYRMRRFFEACQDDAIVSPLVRQLPWTHNLIILSLSKLPQEREFYLRLAAQENGASASLNSSSGRLTGSRHRSMAQTWRICVIKYLINASIHTSVRANQRHGGLAGRERCVLQDAAR